MFYIVIASLIAVIVTLLAALIVVAFGAILGATLTAISTVLFELKNSKNSKVQLRLSDYLEILDYKTWKEFSLVKHQLEKKHKCILRQEEICTQLEYLRAEGYIENTDFVCVLPNSGITKSSAFRKVRDSNDGAEFEKPPMPAELVTC